MCTPAMSLLVMTEMWIKLEDIASHPSASERI